MKRNQYTKLRDGTEHGRIINGCWQFSEGHSNHTEDPILSIQKYVDTWFLTFDGADIYTGVEEIFWTILQNNVNTRIRFHTKHVPDLNDVRNWNITQSMTRTQILRSCDRLSIKKLDNVQFHWWDYSMKWYEISIRELLDLQKQWVIDQIWITNTNVLFLKKLEKELSFIPMTTQNQYSLIDRRAESQLIPHCIEKHIWLYCYGSLMGGLISEKYLQASEPQEPLENRSLRKYMRVLYDWGDWELFQELLEALSTIWRKHNATISEIAIAWTLGRKWVSSAIIGMRHPKHVHSLKKVYSIELDNDDLEKIESIYKKWSPLEWDVFDLERDEPRHRDIMKFNLNKNHK